MKIFIYMCGVVKEKKEPEFVNRKLITKGIITKDLKNFIKKKAYL